MRRSRNGGYVVFLLNLAREDTAVTVTHSPEWKTTRPRDLLADAELPVFGGTVDFTILAW